MPLTPPYSLLTRTAKGSQLTIDELDGNLLWLSTTMSGSINSITGSLGISGSNIEVVTSLFNLFSETLITGSVTINPNSIPNPISGSYTLDGSLIFNGDLTISSGSELIIPSGIALTLNGALINNGNLVNNGSYINLAPTSPYMTLSVLGNVSASGYYGDGSGLTGVTATLPAGVISSSLQFTNTDDVTFRNITASGNISASGDTTTSALTVAGLAYPTTDGTDGQAIITDGAGNLSFATATTEKLHLQVRNDDSVDITAGTPVYSTGEIGGSERIKVRISSASDASTMPAIGITETTLTTAGGTKDGFAIINGIYNNDVTPVGSSPSLGDTIYVHCDGGLTVNKPSGSNLIQNIGIVLKTNGTVIQGMKVSSIDRTNDVPNLLHNQIFYGSGSNQSYQIHVSGALDSTVINNITASGNISSSGTVHGSIYKVDGVTALASNLDVLVIGKQLRDTRYDSRNHKFNGHITASGNISSSAAIAAGRGLFDSFISVNTIYGGGAAGTNNAITLNSADNTGMTLRGPVTASGNISSSGTVTALTGSFGTITGLSPITVTDSITFQQPITASIISASTFSGDGSGLANVPESTDIDVYLNFEEARSYAYIVPYNLQFAGFTTSSAMTVQISSSGAPYVFTSSLSQFSTLSITSSAAGLITLSGSRL